MNKLSHSFLYILTILAVLMVSAFGTSVVYADGGTSTDPPPEEQSNTSPDTAAEEEPAGKTPVDPSPSEVPQDDPSETIPAEEPPPEITQEGQDPPTNEPSAEEPVSVPEVLEQTPGETTLVILNEEGAAEPLASQEAADILVEGDPIWCPEGQSPTPGANGCTPSYSTFGNLITELENQTLDTYLGDGVIWVEASYAGADNSDIIFDGTSGLLNTLDAVTILGGWDGNSGSTSINPSTPSTVDEDMRFENWAGAISIKNLTFLNPGVPDVSLVVETDGNISLDNVSVTGNTSGDGASLDNDLSGGCIECGNITVKNSSFSTNGVDGLVTQSKGNTSISDSTASDNLDDGFDLNGDIAGSNSVRLKNVTVTGNQNDGIDIDDFGGNATLIDITATGNEYDGVELDDIAGNVYGSNITATGNGNIGNADGVDIANTGGSLALYHVTASNNDGNGIQINNTFNGNTKLKFATAINNGDDGVFIQTNGNVTVKCSQLDDNTGDGLQVVDSPTAQLLSLKTARNGGQNVNINTNFTYVTKKEIDCSGKSCSKKSKSTETDYPYKTLVCPPTETTASLNDPLGDEVSFDKLCGYDAGVFDKASSNIPKSIPGGNDYISELYARLLAYLAEAQAEGDQLAAGKYAMILYELAYILPEGYNHAAGLLTVVLEDGLFLDPLPEGAEVTVKFQMPEGLDADEELSILWWNGLGWDDLGGTASVDGLYFQTTTDKIGVFVLAIHEN